MTIYPGGSPLGDASSRPSASLVATTSLWLLLTVWMVVVDDAVVGKVAP
jgi:hypothetical protein